MRGHKRSGGEAVNITEVRVKLLGGRSDRLRAFCSITLDGEFVVHDLRVIDGRKGLFVAMPSRKLSDNCVRCGGKNHLRAKFCTDCGARLDESRAQKGPRPREKFHVDVAHPINPGCRDAIQTAVLVAYEEERGRAEAGLAPEHPYEPDDVMHYDEHDERGDEGPLKAHEAEDPSPVEEPELEEELTGVREIEEPYEAPPQEDAEEEPEEQKHEEAEQEEAGGFGDGIL